MLANKCIAGALRKKTMKQKSLTNIEFSPIGGLAHGPEIFIVDTAFMAAHFPLQGCLGSKSNKRSYFPKTAETTPIFRKVHE